MATNTRISVVDLSAMAAFVQVVEGRSFSAAARGLGLTRSAVSRQIAGLEDRLGARLLNRTTRRLSVTEAGAVYYEHCARILADIRAAERAVMDLDEAPRGLLRVNAPMSFGLGHLGPAVAEFAAAHPALKVELTLDDRVVDLVGEGYDLAIRIAELPPSTLIARRLAVSRRMVCAAPAYLERAGRPQRPEDLSRHACLGYSYLVTGNDWRFRGPDGPITVRIDPVLSANNGDVLCQMAVAGLGIMLAPSFIAGDDLRAGRLVPLLADWTDADTGIFAVYPHSRHLSPKVRAFVDFLVVRFGPDPYWDAGL
jgi:DNA-binding transcriptional LysR family regulator